MTPAATTILHVASIFAAGVVGFSLAIAGPFVVDFVSRRLARRRRLDRLAEDVQASSGDVQFTGEAAGTLANRASRCEAEVLRDRRSDAGLSVLRRFVGRPAPSGRGIEVGTQERQPRPGEQWSREVNAVEGRGAGGARAGPRQLRLRPIPPRTPRPRPRSRFRTIPDRRAATWASRARGRGGPQPDQGLRDRVDGDAVGGLGCLVRRVGPVVSRGGLRR